MDTSIEEFRSVIEMGSGLMYNVHTFFGMIITKAPVVSSKI